MVAKGKTYGKRKARNLVAIFSDLSITPSKSGKWICCLCIRLVGWLTVVDTNAISQVLAPAPNSHNEPLLEPKAAPKEEQAAEIADQDDSK